jgi:hypothetical protein
MSVEPIPGGDVVGEPTLAVIESAGYENLELWSNRLLNDCGFVRSTIDALTADGAISTVNGGNTDVGVAAGGFEGTTHPSFVFTIRDSGFDPVSASDVDVLDNALGYVLNQEGTAHFSPDNFKAYAFALIPLQAPRGGRMRFGCCRLVAPLGRAPGRCVNPRDDRADIP